VRRAKELIRAGDLYQVNLARDFGSPCAARGSTFIDGWPSARAPPFGACMNLGEVFVCASSPELFLRLDPAGAYARAHQGNSPARRDAEADERRANELDESPKENAELTMILDVERNDLGRVAVPGSVRILAGPYIETHPTLHTDSRWSKLGCAPTKPRTIYLRRCFRAGA